MASMWERQRSESSPAYAAFVQYRDLPPAARSLARVGQECGKSKSLLGRWSVRWRWVERVRAYDAHLATIEQAAREQALAAEAARWAERRRQECEEEWTVAQQLLARALQILAHPLTKETVGENGTTAVEPARWTVKDAATYASVGAKLARLAAELETERVEHRGELTLRQAVEQIAATEGLDAMAVLAEAERLLAALGEQDR
jgi:hypothetical protein